MVGGREEGGLGRAAEGSEEAGPGVGGGSGAWRSEGPRGRGRRPGGRKGLGAGGRGRRLRVRGGLGAEGRLAAAGSKEVEGPGARARASPPRLCCCRLRRRRTCPRRLARPRRCGWRGSRGLERRRLFSFSGLGWAVTAVECGLVHRRSRGDPGVEPHGEKFCESNYFIVCLFPASRTVFPSILLKFRDPVFFKLHIGILWVRRRRKYGLPDSFCS